MTTGGSTVGWPEYDPQALAAACASFRQDWQDRWVLEAAGFRIIGMNSQLFGSNLPEEAEQSEWLREELGKPSQHLRVLLAHVPILKRPGGRFLRRIGTDVPQATSEKTSLGYSELLSS